MTNLLTLINNDDKEFILVVKKEGREPVNTQLEKEEYNAILDMIIVYLDGQLINICP